jgi:hypothetical protein
MIDPTGKDQHVDSTGDSNFSFEFLMGLALTAKVFRSPDCRFYVQLGGREFHRLNSAAFRDWLIKDYRKIEPSNPSAAVIRRVIATLETNARNGHFHAPVFVRTGADRIDASSNYFLDLADGTRRAVKITARGWSVVNRHGIPFRRPRGLLPLTAPSHNGSINLLRSYVNLNDSDFRHTVVWLASAVLPCGPHPILLIRGDDGTGKSTLATVLRSLVDPDARPLLGMAANAVEVIATSVDRWVLAYDDIPVMPAWFSRALCHLARSPRFPSTLTPAGKAATMPLGTHPVIVSGLENCKDQVELNQFTYCVHLKPILFDNRRGEDEFWRSFQADHPRILGGLLDLLTEGLSLAHAERRLA